MLPGKIMVKGGDCIFEPYTYEYSYLDLDRLMIYALSQTLLKMKKRTKFENYHHASIVVHMRSRVRSSQRLIFHGQKKSPLKCVQL